MRADESGATYKQALTTTFYTYARRASARAAFRYGRLIDYTARRRWPEFLAAAAKNGALQAWRARYAAMRRDELLSGKYRSERVSHIATAVASRRQGHFDALLCFSHEF